MAKVRPADAKLPPGWYAKHALEEAKRGDPGHLIGRLLSRRQLTDDEIQFIAEVLEKTGDKRRVATSSRRCSGGRAAATGNHIWADRYDGDLTDVFALQDEITKKVVAVLEPKLLEAEGIRSQNRSPEDLGAWDVVIYANSLFWRLTKTEGEAAIAILRKAVERYPDYAPAHSMLAFACWYRGYWAGPS